MGALNAHLTNSSAYFWLSHIWVLRTLYSTHWHTFGSCWGEASVFPNLAKLQLIGVIRAVVAHSPHAVLPLRKGRVLVHISMSVKRWLSELHLVISHAFQLLMLGKVLPRKCLLFLGLLLDVFAATRHLGWWLFLVPLTRRRRLFNLQLFTHGGSSLFWF